MCVPLFDLGVIVMMIVVVVLIVVAMKMVMTMVIDAVRANDTTKVGIRTPFHFCTIPLFTV